MTRTLSDVNRSIKASPLVLQLAFIFLAFILIGSNDGMTGVLIPSMQEHYRIDKATVSFIFLGSTAGYLIAAFLSGPLVAWLGQRWFLLLGTGLFTLSVAGLSQAPPFILFALLLVPLGSGIAMLDAGLNAYVAALPRSTALLNYLHAFYGFGALLGPIIGSAFLASMLLWNNVYLVLVVTGLIVLLGFFLVFRAGSQEIGPDEAAREQESSGATSNILVATLRLQIVWIAALLLLLYVGLEISIGSWLYSYLTEERAMPTVIAGWMNSGYWMGLVIGRLLMGWFIDRLGERRAIQYCMIGVGAGVLVAWFIPSGIVVALAFIWVGFCLGPVFPTVIALMPQLVAPRLLASSIGFLASLGSMGGAFFPLIAGNLVQRAGMWTLLPYAVVLTVVLTILWLLFAAYPQHRKQ